MVNATHVEKVLASLLVDDASNRRKKGWNNYMRTRQRLSAYKNKHPEQYNQHLTVIVSELDKLKQAAKPS